MKNKFIFDDLKILAKDINVSYNKLKNEWKTKSEDDVQQLVDKIYQTKVEGCLTRHPSTVVEKFEIKHMLEEMHK